MTQTSGAIGQTSEDKQSEDAKQKWTFIYPMRRLVSSPWLLCILIGVIALGFNLYRLGTPGIWFDEAFSVELARQPLPLLWHIIWGPEPNMELYYLNEPMFRHEKPQAGRVREHHQFGCEALGDGDPAIDAEMIALLYDFYANLGLKHIRVFINSIGDGNCRPQYIEILKDYYRPLLAESCQDCQVRFYKNPLRLLDCKEPQDQPKIAAAPKIIDYLCEPCREHFDAVQRFLRVYSLPYELDPLIVRGLDYYTRTVFEFTSDIDKLALNGGGRYDGLAEILGGAHTPGIGFGAGIERTILEMKRQQVTPPAEERPLAFVVYFGKSPKYKEVAVRTVAVLRHNRIKTEMAYGERSAKSQMKQANNSGASFAILIGEQELAGGFVTVKDLQAEGLGIESKQVEVKEEELVGYLKDRREQRESQD